MREAQTHLEVILAASGYAVENGFAPLGLDYSPIKGPEGNIEFLMYVKKSEAPHPVAPELTRAVVSAAHAALT